MQKPCMLCIRQEKHLATQIGFDLARLRALAECPADYCEELLLLDPQKPHKTRVVLNVRGDLRRAQQLILQRVLLPKLKPSDFSFGGIRGRDIKQNADQHRNSTFVLTCDISDFYPSIHRKRVYNLFCNRFQCSPDVSRLLTLLCTFRHHLALGLITSPLLADQIVSPLDYRLSQMSAQAGLVYSRYVDDLSFSGAFDLSKSGLAQTVRSILISSGFSTNPLKDKYGRLGDADALITRIRVNRGRLDVAANYVLELRRQLQDHYQIGRGKGFDGPFYTSAQLWGRIQFVSWVRPGRRAGLRKLFAQINWKQAALEAQKRGLVAQRRLLIPA